MDNFTIPEDLIEEEAPLTPQVKEAPTDVVVPANDPDRSKLLNKEGLGEPSQMVIPEDLIEEPTDEQILQRNANRALGKDEIPGSGPEDAHPYLASPQVYQTIEKKYPLISRMMDTMDGNFETAVLQEGLWGYGAGDPNAIIDFTQPNWKPFLPEGYDGPTKVTRQWLRDQYHSREKDMQDLYEKIGKEDNWGKEGIWEYPARTQLAQEDNPDFDPTQDESETNKRTIERKYMVPPPDQDQLIRIGYNVARNIASFVGDTIEGASKLEFSPTTERSTSSALPPAVPENGAEAFVTEMLTYMIPAEAVPKAIEGTAKGLRMTAGLAARTTKYLSPELAANVKTVYNNILSKTGSTLKATEGARSYLKTGLVGLAIGYTEAGIAPPNTEPNFEVTKKAFQNLGMDEKTAKDFALTFESPVISGVVRGIGFAAKKGKNGFFGAFGGLRATSAKKIVGMAEDEVGTRLISYIDPMMFEDSVETAAFRVKILNDALIEDSTRQLELRGAKAELSLDTATATVTASSRYYRTAYAYKEAEMGKDAFDKWVNDQARNMTIRMFAVRSAIGSPEMAEKMGQMAKTVSDLYKGSAGSFEQSLKDLSVIMTDEYKIRKGTMEGVLDSSKKQFETSKAALDTAFESSPEIRDLMTQAEKQFSLGSKAPIDEQMKKTLGDKLYTSFKKMYGDVQDKYKAVGATGVEADYDLFKEKVKELNLWTIDKTGETVSGDTIDSFSKRILNMVDSNPSYGNMVTNVANEIKRKMYSMPKGSPEIDAYQQLLDHIYIDQAKVINGGPAVSKLLDDAKQSYIDYITAWKQEPSLRSLSEVGTSRYHLEGKDTGILPPGVAQGQIEWNKNSIKTFTDNLSDRSKEYMNGVIRAAKVGGEPIDQDLLGILTSEAAYNLANKAISGQQNRAGLRSSLKGLIENLELVNSPHVARFKKLDADLQVLENTANTSEKAYKDLLIKFNEQKSELQNSVAAKFVSDADGMIEPAANPVGVMKQLFESGDSGNRLTALMRKAEDPAMGPKGAIIKEAIKTSYIDYLRNKMRSNESLGIAELTKEGRTIKGYRPSESFMNDFFDSPKIKGELQIIFKDEPEVLEQMKNVNITLDNATKDLQAGKDPLKTPITSDINPKAGLTSLISTTLGVLNPTATRVRRFTNTWGELKLEEVTKAKNAILLAAMIDPKETGRIMAASVAGELIRKDRDALIYLISKGSLLAQRDTGTKPGEAIPADYGVPDGVNIKGSEGNVGPKGDKGVIPETQMEKALSWKSPFKGQSKDVSPADAQGEYKGLIERGNINLEKRPLVKDPKTGKTGTVNSFSFETEPGIEVIVPGISNGRFLTEEQARKRFEATGEFLAKFKITDGDYSEADRYGEDLHNAQAKFYGLE